VMKMRGLPLEDIAQHRSRKKLERDVAYMNGIADRIVRERREIPAAADEAKPDLLGVMLSGLDRQSGERLDDVNIRYQMNTFLIAGHETTSGMLSFAIYFLLNNPHVLQKAYDEVDRVLGRNINAKPTAQQVNRLVYVGQILKETLRLWPTAPAFGLYPYENETIGGKYKLRRKTFVTVLTAMLHRDPSVWGPQAEVFNPDNFAPEREAKMPGHVFKPFGNGQRACIGRQFAMTEATLLLGLILQRFKLIDHTRYQLKIKESLTIKPEGLTMRVRLRPDVLRGAVTDVAVTKTTAPKPVAKRKAKSHGAKLTVLFGSNMGTAEELARSIAESGEAAGFATTLAGLDDHAGSLPTEGAVVIVSASYNGGPPDNAGQFLKSLREAPANAFAGIRYTVFGCGNRDWASTYQSIPRQIDELLAQKGAERLHARGEGDAKEDLDGDFQEWNRPLLPALADKLGVKLEADSGAPAEPLYQVQVVDQAPVNPIIGGAGALPMRVLANRELQNCERSGRSTRHIEVQLPDGVSYRAGETVQAFVKETKVGFRLPIDPAAPIVMIGPGTGLAPFRGFLRERASLRAQGRSLGPAMLFFGCRHPEQDFIYAEELKALAKEGTVDLHVAFSRHDGKKVYVQDLLKQQAKALWPLIDQGAIIYVCGDGGRMEPDVKRALIALRCEHAGDDEAAGEAWMAAMAGEGRYVLDVWAST
jgi:cytochrome P450/NADPH-cytochrome P450 reductase